MDGNEAAEMEAVEELSSLRDMRDRIAVHGRADEVLRKLLNSIGLRKVVKLYDLVVA